MWLGGGRRSRARRRVFCHQLGGNRGYWVIDASCWPGGIDRPVQYGVVPNCGKDKTADHKGTWEAPQPGVTYKVSVAGFGGDITETEVVW